MSKASKVEESREITAARANDLRHKIGRDAKRANETPIYEQLEEVKMHVGRFLKLGRYAFDDGVIDAVHSIKRRPLGFLAIAFICGTTLGLIVGHHKR